MPRVLFFLPNISTYPDRVSLLMEVSRGLDRLVLLVGRKDVELDTTGFERFQVAEVGFRPGMRPWNLWKASQRASQLIDEADIDVVHDTFATLVLLFRNRARHPKVWFLTSLFGPSAWRLRHVFNNVNKARLLTWKGTALMLSNRWLEKRVSLAADWVVLQAPGLIDRFLEDVEVPRSRIGVLTNNVDTGFWTPNGAPRSMDLPRDGCRLLFVGGVDHSRGIFTLIEAMRKLRDQGDPSRLKIVGDWNPLARRRGQDLISRHGLEETIVFAHKTDREGLRRHYRNSDLFIYQTINDGSPRVVLEALASGLPVIASHHPGIDVLDADGEFIAFNEFGDSDSILSYVRDFREDPSQWDERSRRGREAIERRFSVPAVARQYVDFYHSLDAATPMAGS